jgi:flagellar motor switch protein FliN
MNSGTSELGAVVDLAEFADELSGSIESMTALQNGNDRMDLAVARSGENGGAISQKGPSSTVGRGLDDIIAEIPVTLKVVLGTAKMPVASISKLTRGTVIRLDNKVGDPVDIYVNGRLLARGQVVVLDEGSSRFGVTLTQIGGSSSIKT